MSGSGLGAVLVCCCEHDNDLGSTRARNYLIRVGTINFPCRLLCDSYMTDINKYLVFIFLFIY
jgi:hypothetical protein